MQLSRKKATFLIPTRSTLSHKDVMVGPPTQLRQGRIQFNLLCTKRQDQQFTKARVLGVLFPARLKDLDSFSRKV